MDRWRRHRCYWMRPVQSPLSLLPSLSPVFPSQQMCPAQLDSILLFGFVYSKINHFIYSSSAVYNSWEFAGEGMKPQTPLICYKSEVGTSCSSSHHYYCRAFIPCGLTAAGSKKIFLFPVVLGALWCWVVGEALSRTGWNAVISVHRISVWTLPGFLWFWLTDFSSFLLLKSNGINKGFRFLGNF